MGKEFFMHCDYCGRKVVIQDLSGLQGLKEANLAPIPGGVPELDAEKKKVKIKKSLPRRRMFKCSNCGRGIILKQSTVAIPENFKETVSEEEDNSTGCEGSTAGSEIQGNPTGKPSAGRSKIHEQPWMRLQSPNLSKDHA